MLAFGDDIFGSLLLISAKLCFAREKVAASSQKGWVKEIIIPYFESALYFG